MLKQTNLAARISKIRSKVKFLKLGHSDLILKNLVKGHIELPYETTMLKQTNLAARLCKIRSKAKFSMCSQIIGNQVTVTYIYDRIVGKGPKYQHTNFQWHTKISTCFQFNSSVYLDDCSYGLDLEHEGQVH